jgi:hypothetical protein
MKGSILISIEHFQNLIIGSGVAGKILAWTLARGPENGRHRTR